MGVTRSEIFSPTQNQLAAAAKVLGHPARIAILEQLSKSEGCVCGNFVAEIGLAQATISQHLAELKKIGIIKGTVVGTSVCYCIDKDMWNALKKQFTIFFNTGKCC